MKKLKHWQAHEQTALSSHLDAQHRDVTGLVNQKEIVRGRLSQAFGNEPDKADNAMARDLKKKSPEQDRPQGHSFS